ncbi:hypothetical protein Hanom_Chr01g00044601 [Helianthus anomalus]
MLTLFCHRSTREPFILCYPYCSIMSGCVNMTQAQLTALINEQDAAALAAAQAGGITCYSKPILGC